jgi:hypothetical protein
MVIQYFDALAGAGKTRALSRYAIKLATAGERVLFVQPSKQLIKATIADEFRQAASTLSVRAIHGDNSKQVTQEIIQHSKASRPGKGAVLFITHAAFMRLPYIESRHQWHVIFDEVPTVDLVDPFNVPETHRLITDALSFSPHDAAYGFFSAREGAEIALRKIARNPRGDEIWGKFKGFAERVLSPHWDVFALQSNYHALLSGDHSTRQLVTHSILKPSIFDGYKQVILASALFTQSTLYRLWTAQGVAFTPVADHMVLGLRYHRHSNGALITIRYLLDRDWSKTLRDKPICLDGEDIPRSLRDRLPGLIGAAHGGQTFAWMGNTDIADDYFGSTEAVRLPNSPHGLNGFQHLHHVAVLSALNARPAHFRFMETRGIAGEALRTASYRSAVYQAAMRISIRDPHDKTPKSITVMDAATAHWLAELFPGSRVEPLTDTGLVIPGVPVGRPRKHASRADRQRAHRSRKRNRQWLDSFCAVSDQSAASFGTVYASIHDTEPTLYLDGTNLEAFVALLKEAHGRVVPSKQDNFLISPAHFDPDAPDSETSRGLANVRHVNGLWLDNDGGDLSHADFAKLFPQLRMLVWNTHSSTREAPRWRCFIPTDTVMSVDEHARLIQQIVMVLRYNGFSSHHETVQMPTAAARRHGFDTSKFTAASLFYAPCQAANPRESFFIDYHEPVRDPLDVGQWLVNDIATYAMDEAYQDVGDCGGEDEDPLPATGNTGPLLTAALTRWRRAGHGQGHGAFFRLACDLRRSGMERQGARHHLLAEARKARSPQERSREVPNLLKHIWKK